MKPSQSKTPPPEPQPREKAIRRHERRQDYRVLWNAVRRCREDHAQHNVGLSHELTAILDSVGAPEWLPETPSTTNQ